MPSLGLAVAWWFRPQGLGGQQLSPTFTAGPICRMGLFLSGGSTSGTFTKEGAHGSRGKESGWNSGPHPPVLGPALLTPTWWNTWRGLTFVKGSRLMEPAVSACGISRNFSSYLSPLRGDELREGFS